MSVRNKKTDNYGRNVGLYNDIVRETLSFVCRSEVPVTSGKIAQHIRRDDTHRMSNEYKIIKRLIRDSDTVNPFAISQRRYLDTAIAENGLRGYAINFRGFLLYLYNEYLMRKDSSKDFEKESDRKLHHLRRRTINKNIHFNQTITKRLRIVLYNPLTIKIAPFLQYWSEFEKYGFNVIELLLQISIELQNQMHIDAYGDTYLIRRATERYVIALENFIYDYELYSMKVHKPLKELINSYRKLIVPLTRNLINKEIERLDFIQREHDEFEMLQELDSMVLRGSNEAISIDKIGHQYINSFKNSVSVLEIVKNKRKYHDYVLADSFDTKNFFGKYPDYYFQIILAIQTLLKSLNKIIFPNSVYQTS